MTWAHLTLLFLNLFLASCALWAAITAKSTLKELRRKLAERSTRSLHELDSEVTALASAQASNAKTLKRLSSKIGMQDFRERQRAEPELPANASPAERKIWLRKGLAHGTLRVVRDNPAAGNE